jgi:hypothetical protein
MWELSHWRQSYYGVALGEIRDSIKCGDRLPLDDDIPDGVKSVITQCWGQNPRERPGFKDILRYIKGLSELKTDNDILATCKLPVIPKYELQEQTVPAVLIRSSPAAPETTSSAVPNSTIANVALVRFWDNATLDAAEITWDVFFDSVSAFLDLENLSDLDTERLRKRLDIRMVTERPTLRKLYLVIGEKDPKLYFKDFIVQKKWQWTSSKIQNNSELRSVKVKDFIKC